MWSRGPRSEVVAWLAGVLRLADVVWSAVEEEVIADASSSIIVLAREAMTSEMKPVEGRPNCSYYCRSCWLGRLQQVEIVLVCNIGVSSYNVALFHLINHAFYKGLLFLGASAAIHAVADNQDFRKYGGLRTFLRL